MTNEKDFSLNSPKRIEWVLKSLQNQHQLISLTLTNSELSASSMVISVSSADGFLMLDAVHDDYIHKQISRSAGFSLKTYLNGIDVLAEHLQATEAIEDADGFLYKVPFPAVINYMQRRDSFRASTCGIFEIEVQVKAPSNSTMYGATSLPDTHCILSNISANGCELSIRGEIADQAAVLKTAVEINFQLPESDKQMSLSASPRHCRYLKRSGIWLVGYQFTGTTPGELTSLSQFVSKMQMWSNKKTLSSN